MDKRKRKSLGAFIVLWAFTVVTYFLKATGNIGDYIQAGFYIIVASVSFLVLLFIKSDEPYYSNLTMQNMVLAVIAGLIMTAISWGLSIKIFNSALKMPFTLAFIAAPSSTISAFISLVLFGLVMVATSEELLKLTAFSEFKDRYGDRKWGFLVYIGFPVGFWALIHGIMAYDDPILIIPALVNGVVLIVLLIYTKCIFAAIMSHWLYNTGITFIMFLNGYGTNMGLPFLPNYSNLPTSELFFEISLFVLLAAWILFFMIPSLRCKK